MVRTALLLAIVKCVYQLAQHVCFQPAGLTTKRLTIASYTFLTIEIHTTKFIFKVSILCILLLLNTF